MRSFVKPGGPSRIHSGGVPPEPPDTAKGGPIPACENGSSTRRRSAVGPGDCVDMRKGIRYIPRARCRRRRGIAPGFSGHPPLFLLFLPRTNTPRHHRTGEDPIRAAAHILVETWNLQGRPAGRPDEGQASTIPYQKAVSITRPGWQLNADCLFFLGVFVSLCEPAFSAAVCITPSGVNPHVGNDHRRPVL